MPSLNLLVIGDEKALPEFEDALETCKRYVGPIKLFTAHKAVDGVSRLQKLVQTCGQCHAAFLSNHFTCPGKEEFSETLRKVLKEKYADVPVICWGNPKKGGELNKHFHATLDFTKGSADVNDLVDILKQVQAGQIRVEYLHKDQRKSLERRNSLERNDSIRGFGRSDSISRRTDSQRRSSIDAIRPPMLERTASSRRSVPEDDLSPAASAAAAMHVNPTLRRRSMERASVDAMGLASMPSANAMGMAAAMGGMGATLGGMGPGIAGGMAPGLGGMSGGMGMGAMASSMGPSATGGIMGSMSGGLAGGVAVGAGMGMSAAPSMHRTGSLVGGVTAVPMGVGVGNIGGVGSISGDLTGMMGGMNLGGVSSSVKMPAVAPPVPQTPVVPASGGAGSSGNAELIRMLAEEVVRLRKAVEEKRAREAGMASQQQQQQQLMELQQQQMLLQQQLAASGGMGMGVSLGGGMMTGGGMPMGI